MKITERTLSAWIDGGLSPQRMKAVSAAVESNPDLLARAEALRAVGAVLRDDSVEVPVTAERMAADVRRAIRLQDSRRSSRFPLWGWAGATACSCLILAAILVPSMRVGGEPVFQAEIESVESGLSGASTMVYSDFDAGWTVIWLDGVELEPGI
jgi:anti-sigma factor RsiW